ncbi:MAG: histidine phosphatase family protein [Pirellulaceae bacterium]
MAKMNRLLLIRHGQSANNALPEHERVCDPGLTEVGVQQAAETAKHLSREAITHLYCSPFLRALETVKPLATTMQMLVSVNPTIFERGGCYSGWMQENMRGEPGMGRGHLERAYPGWKIDNAISMDGWWGRDRETDEECAVRARFVADWITRDVMAVEGTHAMVIHADFKSLLVPALLAISGRELKEVEPLRNTGITELLWSADASNGWELRSYNSTEHLPNALWTH